MIISNLKVNILISYFSMVIMFSDSRPLMPQTKVSAYGGLHSLFLSIISYAEFRSLERRSYCK